MLPTGGITIRNVRGDRQMIAARLTGMFPRLVELTCGHYLKNDWKKHSVTLDGPSLPISWATWRSPSLGRLQGLLPKSAEKSTQKTSVF